MPEKTASIKDVAEAVKVEGETLSDFSKEWRKLTPEDKDDLRKGVADGSMTY